MNCLICGTIIELNQLRHSDGLGSYHMLCEFNLERERMGLPTFQSLRRTKFISGFYTNGYDREVKQIAENGLMGSPI